MFVQIFSLFYAFYIVYKTLKIPIFAEAVKFRIFDHERIFQNSISVLDEGSYWSNYILAARKREGGLKFR